MKLHEAAKLIRCKNAGPFALTIDILFETEELYQKVINSKVLTTGLIAKLYGMPEKDIQYYTLPGARAIKFSFPRTVFAGDFEDSDVFGCQFHAPLVEMEIPIS